MTTPTTGTGRDEALALGEALPGQEQTGTSEHGVPFVGVLTLGTRESIGEQQLRNLEANGWTLVHLTGEPDLREPLKRLATAGEIVRDGLDPAFGEAVDAAFDALTRHVPSQNSPADLVLREGPESRLSRAKARGFGGVNLDASESIYDSEAQPSGLAADIDAVADALNGWDQGEPPRPDTHRHWSKIVAALTPTDPEPRDPPPGEFLRPEFLAHIRPAVERLRQRLDVERLGKAMVGAFREVGQRAHPAMKGDGWPSYTEKGASTGPLVVSELAVEVAARLFPVPDPAIGYGEPPGYEGTGMLTPLTDTDADRETP